MAKTPPLFDSMVQPWGLVLQKRIERLPRQNDVVLIIRRDYAFKHGYAPSTPSASGTVDTDRSPNTEAYSVNESPLHMKML